MYSQGRGTGRVMEIIHRSQERPVHLNLQVFKQRYRTHQAAKRGILKATLCLTISNSLLSPAADLPAALPGSLSPCSPGVGVRGKVEGFHLPRLFINTWLVPCSPLAWLSGPK